MTICCAVTEPPPPHLLFCCCSEHVLQHLSGKRNRSSDPDLVMFFLCNLSADTFPCARPRTHCEIVLRRRTVPPSFYYVSPSFFPPLCVLLHSNVAQLLSRRTRIVCFIPFSGRSERYFVNGAALEFVIINLQQHIACYIACYIATV